MEQKTKIGDLAKTAKEAESEVQKWLVVLARCFQLQDAIAVTRTRPCARRGSGQLDGHRLGLKAARRNRMDSFHRAPRLCGPHGAAAGMANTKVLLHPSESPAVVQSNNHVASAVADFQGRLGIESVASRLRHTMGRRGR